jgi:hypothetical protein
MELIPLNDTLHLYHGGTSSATFYRLFIVYLIITAPFRYLPMASTRDGIFICSVDAVRRSNRKV